MKKIGMFILILILIIFSIWVFYYPYTKYIANKNFDKYISKQNIDEKNILLKHENFGYPKYVYFFIVTYKDQNEYKYEYQYKPNSENPFKIKLFIYKNENLSKGVSIKDMSEIKYPPLNQEEIKKWFEKIESLIIYNDVIYSLFYFFPVNNFKIKIKKAHFS